MIFDVDFGKSFSDDCTKVFVKGYSDGLAATNDSRVIWGVLNTGTVRSSAFVFGNVTS